MKSFAIITVLLTIGIYLPPRCEAQQPTNKTAQQRADNSQPSSITYVDNRRNEAEKQATQNKSPNGYVSPEWALVFVGGITFFVIGWQAVATADAAKATQESAKATAEQSENMMARERARLSIIPPINDPKIDSITIEDVDGTVSQFLELYIDVINDGESKAFNVSASGDFLVEVIQLGKPYASHSAAKLAIPKVIGNASTDNPVRVYLARSGLGPKVLILSSDWQDVLTGSKPLHMIGTISYEDVFGKPHHTPFWYTWQVRTDNGNWGDESEWTDRSDASD